MFAYSSLPVDQDLVHRVMGLQHMLRETPLVQLKHERFNLYAKLEFQNPFGSLKDRAAFGILKAAILRGDVVRDTTLIESSSGNFASALASFCRLLGLRFIPVIDPNIPSAYESLLRQTCETVVKVEQRDDTGGYLKTRLRKVEELLAQIPGSFWTNQYNNPDNTAAHYQYTGAEICRALPRLDYAFIGVSSAGTLSGISRRLKDHYPSVKIIAVDAVGSVIFGGPPKKRLIPGIGASITPPLLKQCRYDETVYVPEHDTVTACHELLNEHGLFVGGSTGTVYAAIQQYAERLNTFERPTAVFLCADRGTAYLNTLYNPEWVKQHLG
jgi:2,3-diaminopropionate biosynthesis protein SbnA